MTNATFADRYCARHGITRDDYARHLLRRILYPQARLIAPLIELLDSDYFAAEMDFIDDVSGLTEYHEFFGSSVEFAHHPANRGWPRHLLRMRGSSERMRRIVRAELRTGGSRAP